MADEPNLDIDTQASVEADLARLKAGEQKPPTPPEGAETGIPPVEPPPAEPKKDEPTPAAKPKLDDELEQRADEKWGQLKREWKEARRRADEFERELRAIKEAQAKSAQDEPAKEPTKDEAPVDYFDREIQRLNQQMEADRRARQQRDAQLEMEQQETRFAQQHPDYMDARNFLEKQTEEEWNESGLSNLYVSQLREQIRRGRAGDAQFRGVVEHVDKWSQAEAVQKAADEQNRDPEDVAIWKVARDTYIQQELIKEQQAAAAAGRTLPENLYRRAQRVGYKPSQQPNGQKPAETGEQARQRVLNSQKVAEAANSLSEAGNTSDVEGKRLIKSREDVMNMNDDELDALIASGKWREL